jgi:hypothetical protein
MQGNRTLSGAVSAISRPAVIDLTADEQAQVRSEVEHVVAMAVDVIPSAETAAALEAGIAKLRTAHTMLCAAESGELTCTADVLSVLVESLDMLQLDMAGARAAVARYDEQGPEGYWSAELRSQLTVENMLEDITGTRADLARHEREQALLTAIMARVERGGES